MVAPIGKSYGPGGLAPMPPRPPCFFSVESIRYPGQLVYAMRYGGVGVRLSAQERLMLAGMCLAPHRAIVFTNDNAQPPVRYVVALHVEHLAAARR